jgi:archaellum biogenesis ATPase FlaH
MGVSNDACIKQDITLASLFQDVFSFEELEQVEEKELIFHHIVPRGINLFVADGGTGKTLLAYRYMPKFLELGYSCVYFDFDNPIDLPKSRGLLSKVKEMGKKDEFVYFTYNSYQRWIDKYSKNKYSLRRFFEWALDRLIEGKKYVVFVDSLQNVIPNVSDDALTYALFKLFRKYVQKIDITFIVLHHISKTAGWSKGSTNIVNMSDVSYRLKSFKENKVVTSFVLIQEKARYLTPEEVTIKLKDDYEIEIVEYAIEDELTKMILRSLVSILRKEGKLNQSRIYDLMKEKNFSRRQVEPILKEYTEKGLFHLERGEKNARYYSVNEESEYVGILFDVELSEVKKELLKELEDIETFPPIRIEREKEKSVEYRTAVALRKDIYKLSDEEAKSVFHQLLDFKAKLMGDNGDSDTNEAIGNDEDSNILEGFDDDNLFEF